MGKGESVGKTRGRQILFSADTSILDAFMVIGARCGQNR